MVLRSILSSTLLCGFIILSNFEIIEGIRCYVCGKDSTNGSQICTTGEKVSSIECPDKISGKVVDACGYTIKEEPDGEEVVRRMCFPSKILSDVVSIQGDPMELGRCYNDITVSVRTLPVLTNYKVFCTCTSDDCNSSSAMNNGQKSHKIWTTPLFQVIVVIIVSANILI